MWRGLDIVNEVQGWTGFRLDLRATSDFALGVYDFLSTASIPASICHGQLRPSLLCLPPKARTKEPVRFLRPVFFSFGLA